MSPRIGGKLKRIDACDIRNLWGLPYHPTYSWIVSPWYVRGTSQNANKINDYYSCFLFSRKNRI